VEERLVRQRCAKGKGFEMCRGTREKKRKNAQGAWIKWRRRREKNGRSRRESGKRHRAKPFN